MLKLLNANLWLDILHVRIFTKNHSPKRALTSWLMVEWLGGKPLSCNGNEVQSLSWILSHAIIASQPGCKQVALATRCRTHNMLGLKWMILATLNWWTQGTFIKYSTLGAIRRQHHSNWRLTQEMFETSIFHIIFLSGDFRYLWLSLPFSIWKCLHVKWCPTCRPGRFDVGS